MASNTSAAGWIANPFIGLAELGKRGVEQIKTAQEAPGVAAKRAADDLKAKGDALLSEEEKRKRKESDDALVASNLADATDKQSNFKNSNRSGTMVTGPQGTTAAAPVIKKSLTGDL